LLAAGDVLGGQLRASVKRLAGELVPHVRRLEGQYLASLRRSGFSPPQRKALAAITPGAMAVSGSPPRDFVEQAEYNGRRLAKLKLDPVTIMLALREYESLLAPVEASLDAARRAGLRDALENWRVCVALTLNNAFYRVAEAETWACHELFRIELQSRSLDELLVGMLQPLSQFCRADAGALYLLDEAGSAWWLKAAVTPGNTESGQAERVPADRASIGRLGRARCESTTGQPLVWALRPAWRDRYRTCWSVPLARDGRLAGVIQFGFTKPYEWLPREAELLSAAAERCLLAAQKARLMEDLARREEQVRELAERMLHVEERERRRISAELHDEAGQSLLCMRLQLEMLEKSVPGSEAGLRASLGELRGMAEKTIIEIRRLISDLSPAVLEQLGLAPALRQLAHRLQQIQKIEVKLRLGRLKPLPKQTAGAVYRLVQECLNNVVRHSGASRVMISVTSADKELRLRVEDNGNGFDLEEALAKRHSFGLAGMRERVILLGGRFNASSQQGRGTRISIELPLTAGKEAQDSGS
jgi:signal transduction histidine kinase